MGTEDEGRREQGMRKGTRDEGGREQRMREEENKRMREEGNKGKSLKMGMREEGNRRDKREGRGERQGEECEDGAAGLLRGRHEGKIVRMQNKWSKNINKKNP